MLLNYSNDLLEMRKKLFEFITDTKNPTNQVIYDYFQNEGKAIRPLLTFIFSRLGNYKKNDAKLKSVAALVELIHTTSLIHDDIIDNAKTRRGKKTLNHLYGDKQSLFIGDFLFATVLNESSKIENDTFHKYLAYTLKELCKGEIIQYKDLYNINTRKIDYLKKIKRKTAILIAFACLSGAVVVEASKEDIRAAYKFGYYLGMSYQIMDDYLDFTSIAENFGKDIGQDLANGNITLATILKIKKDKEKFLNYKNLSLSEKKVLIEEIKNDQAILEEVLNLSHKYLLKAKNEIVSLDEQIKNDLFAVIEQLAMRKK